MLKLLSFRTYYYCHTTASCHVNLRSRSWNAAVGLRHSFFFFFKTFLNLLQYCLCYVLVSWPWGIWDLCSPIRDGTCTLRIGRQSVNHWSSREAAWFPPLLSLLVPLRPQVSMSILVSRNSSRKVVFASLLPTNLSTFS